MTEHKKDFAKFIKEHLNKQQQEAVTSKDGSYLVIAGAGSGKTRVITARITNLILEHNVEPSSIVALTFTNKAAKEMLERVEQALPNLPTRPIIATFHSYCLRLLKTNRHLLSSETFSILDSQDQYKLIQTIIKDHGVANLFNAKKLLSVFSSFKMNDILKINDDIALPTHHMQQFMNLYNEYEQQKRASNYFDFDDLLYKTYELFNKNEPFKLRHHQNHRHILVDEYQDTNLIQHALLKHITLHDNALAVDSVCAVGDEDQSIYSWRGATVQNILDFDKEFKKTKRIKLEQNYRSTQRILDIANHVITNNSQRNHKKLWSENSNNHTPLQLECLSDLQEAYTVTHCIKEFAKSNDLSSIAILYRTHYQSRVIEEALIKESIPYKMVGGIQFYERKEIKDLIAYMRLVVNPFDKMSFLRIVNCPLRGLGKKFEELFIETWNKEPLLNFVQISKKIIEAQLIAPKQRASLTGFINTFKDLTEDSAPTKVLETFIHKTGYLPYLQENFDKQEAETKKQNVAEFVRAAEYVERTQQAALASFLEDIALMQDHIVQDNLTKDCVQMMTLHSAKGLEFENVLLTGLEDGILPSNQSIEMGNIEEERRLFYVGITRAKSKLVLLHSKYRNTFGQMTIQRPSRFLQEIPAHLLHQEAAKHWSKSQFATFFRQWLNNKPVKQCSAYNFEVPAHIKAQDNNKPKTKIHSEFKRLQTVKHPKFGIGISQFVEKSGDKTFVTVHFTNYGKKKIDSSFLEIL